MMKLNKNEMIKCLRQNSNYNVIDYNPSKDQNSYNYELWICLSNNLSKDIHLKSCQNNDKYEIVLKWHNNDDLLDYSIKCTEFYEDLSELSIRISMFLTNNKYNYVFDNVNLISKKLNNWEEFKLF